MSNSTTAIAKVRNLIGDIYLFFADIQKYTGTSAVFTLVYANIQSASLVVYKNGTLWAAGNYSYNSTNGKITITGTLATGDTLEFDYNRYQKYSDAELLGYIKSAIYYLSAEKYKTFKVGSDDEIFPTPTETEENLIALIAQILIEGKTVKSYRTPELQLDFNEKFSKEEKIRYAIMKFNKTFGTIKYIDLTKDVNIPKEDEDE